MSDRLKTKFEILSAPDSIKEEIQQEKKWETRYLAVITKQDLFRILMTEINNETYRAFGMLCYLTGARRGEVAFLKRSSFTNDSLVINDKVYEVLLVKIYNQKSHTIKEKWMPLIRHLEPTEDMMLDFIENYLSKFKDNERLFKQISLSGYDHWLDSAKVQTEYKKPAWKGDESAIIRFQLFPHYLRHCRLTYFSPLGSDCIISIAGWSSKQLGKEVGQLLDTYVRRNWQKIARRRIEEHV